MVNKFLEMSAKLQKLFELCKYIQRFVSKMFDL